MKLQAKKNLNIPFETADQIYDRNIYLGYNATKRNQPIEAGSVFTFKKSYGTYYTDSKVMQTNEVLNGLIGHCTTQKQVMEILIPLGFELIN
jgi:hypothetical protein